MSSVMVPITAEHVCLSLTPRSRICASAELGIRVWRDARDGLMSRTVCGVDAFPVVHAIVNRPGDGVVATWPPPLHGRDADRCPDCADRLGLGRRKQKGCEHWQGLVNPQDAA